VLVKPPWYGALDTNGGKHGVLVKPPWYGALDKQGGIQGVLDRPPWYGVLDKQGAIQGCWLSPHGVVCWISAVEYRGAG
jgi:hypothetical protein